MAESYRAQEKLSKLNISYSPEKPRASSILIMENCPKDFSAEEYVEVEIHKMLWIYGI